MDEAKGNFDGKQQAYTIGANDQLLTAKDYMPLIVAYHNGAPVNISDVGVVIDDAENDKMAAWTNLTPAVIVSVQRQPGANIIAVGSGSRPCCRGCKLRCRRRSRSRS